MIRLHDTIEGKFQFVLVNDSSDVVMMSKLYERKDQARDDAESVAGIDTEVGDFTKRKKPGPKPQNGIAANTMTLSDEE